MRSQIYKKAKRRRKRVGEVEWNDRFYVRAYQLAKQGATDGQVAEILGVSNRRFDEWCTDRPALETALGEGRKSQWTLKDWVYNRMSDAHKKLWDQICELGKEGDIGRIERMLQKEGEGARKYMFLNALATSLFNPTQACRKVNIPYGQFKRWCQDDPEFAGMIVEMEEHKDNAGEAALYSLVTEDKDPAAVIFYNKTRNKKRGYGDKLEIEHTGSVQHQHELTISEELLDRLSIPARRELLTVVDALQIENKEIQNGE